VKITSGARKSLEKTQLGGVEPQKLTELLDLRGPSEIPLSLRVTKNLKLGHEFGGVRKIAAKGALIGRKGRSKTSKKLKRRNQRRARTKAWELKDKIKNAKGIGRIS